MVLQDSQPGKFRYNSLALFQLSGLTHSLTWLLLFSALQPSDSVYCRENNFSLPKELLLSSCVWFEIRKLQKYKIQQVVLK